MAMVYDAQLQYFIITSSMVGLGLSIALYSFIIPYISDIFQQKAARLKGYSNDLKKILAEFQEKLIAGTIDEEKFQKLSEIKQKVSTEENIDFHLGTGFLVTGILFSVSALFPLIDIFDDTTKWVSEISKMSPVFLVCGVAVFILVWILIFFEMKSINKKKFEEAREEAEEKIEEITTQSKQIRSQSVIKKKKKKQSKQIKRKSVKKQKKKST